MFAIFEKIIGTITNLIHRQRPMSMDEVNKALEQRSIERTATTKEYLDWRVSIVDLLKLLDLDNDLPARRKLAEELKFGATFDGTAEQNRELHKLVMEQVAKRCVEIPKP